MIDDNLIHDWLNGPPVYKATGTNEVPDGVEQVTAFYISNIPGDVKIVIANRDTGEMIDLPPDGTVFLFLSKTAARVLHDDLSNPEDFPESL